VRRRIAIGLGVIALAGALWALFFRDADEVLVRRTIDRLARAVEVVPGENPLVRATRVRAELLEVLAPDVSVSIPELTDLSRGRDPLIGVALSAAQLWERAEVGVALARITLEPTNPPGADVALTATLTASRPGGQPERDVRQCRFHLEKREGTWRITEITVHPRDRDGE
jgi:hypothetical protein